MRWLIALYRRSLLAFRSAVISKPRNANKPKPSVDKFFNRIRELQSDGTEFAFAASIAHLEQRIENWPTGWGDDFHFLVYGDFDSLQSKLTIDRLGITVFPENVQNTVIKSGRTVHKAKIEIGEKTLSAVLDASRRINIFLGAFTLITWTNCYCGWWSHMTHGSGGGVRVNLDHPDLRRVVDGAVFVRPEIAEKIEAALFWIRDPKQPMMDLSSSDRLKTFAAYWNAFECLVDAVCLAVPHQKLSRSEKQNKLTEVFKCHGESLTPAFVQDAYKAVVNPGLKARAIHALEICFRGDANHFVHECFERGDKLNRLYDIRNSINHGEVKAENPHELARIESRLSELSIMVMGMLGQFIPYSYPLRRNRNNKQSHG